MTFQLKTTLQIAILVSDLTEIIVNIVTKPVFQIQKLLKTTLLPFTIKSKCRFKNTIVCFYAFQFVIFV